jgi:hypothetical protein
VGFKKRRQAAPQIAVWRFSASPSKSFLYLIRLDEVRRHVSSAKPGPPALCKARKPSCPVVTGSQVATTLRALVSIVRFNKIPCSGSARIKAVPQQPENTALSERDVRAPLVHDSYPKDAKSLKRKMAPRRGFEPRTLQDFEVSQLIDSKKSLKSSKTPKAGFRYKIFSDIVTGLLPLQQLYPLYCSSLTFSNQSPTLPSSAS